MMQRHNGGSEKIERKIIEKNRRIHMKKLCFKLNSLVPSLLSQPFKLITQESQFYHSIAYIEQLKNKIGILKDKRDEIISGDKSNSLCNVTDGRLDHQLAVSCKAISSPPTMELQELEGGLKVLLIINSKGKVLFPKIVSILEDGGAEVVKGGYTTIADKVIYTIHAKARVTRIGIEVTSVHQKLKELINRSL